MAGNRPMNFFSAGEVTVKAQQLQLLSITLWSLL